MILLQPFLALLGRASEFAILLPVLSIWRPETLLLGRELKAQEKCSSLTSGGRVHTIGIKPVSFFVLFTQNSLLLGTSSGSREPIIQAIRRGGVASILSLTSAIHNVPGLRLNGA